MLYAVITYALTILLLRSGAGLGRIGAELAESLAKEIIEEERMEEKMRAKPTTLYET